MTHEQHCIDAQDSYEEILKEFEKAHPNYCKTCEGWGGFYSTYDPSSPGISLGSGTMEDFDPCPDCSDEYKCPHCGHKHSDKWYDDDKVICEACSWDMDHPDGVPEPPECYCGCYEEELLGDVDLLC